MPVTPTKARLWFDTKEQEEIYDDMMMANIEWKTDEDIADENYTIVFNREKQEKFFERTDLAKSELASWNAKYNLNPDEQYKKYGYKGGEATFWKTWTIEKRVAQYGLGYLLLRELPIRNFYARSVVMGLYFANIYENFGLSMFLPYGIGKHHLPVRGMDKWDGA